jgi:hypothetical protein
VPHISVWGLRLSGRRALHRTIFCATLLQILDLHMDYSKIITIEPGKRSGKP